MGYVITGGVGLVLGVGLLIWALRERSKCARAEKAATDADHRLRAALIQADMNAQVAQEAADSQQRVVSQLNVLRERLYEARRRLAKCGDPKAVQDWLDEELKAEEL